jgi:hypothetical protein
MPRLEDLTTEDIGDIISNVEIFQTLSDAMQDEHLDRALMYVVKLIERPDIDPKSAAYAIVQLEALAAKFGYASVVYKTIGKAGTDERYKKDIYYTARDAVRHLVDSLKYIIRTQEASR